VKGTASSLQKTGATFPKGSVTEQVDEEN